MTNPFIDFTPDGWEAINVKPPSKYWNPGEFPQGETLLRVLSKPITGWLEWHDKKPYRYKPLNKPAAPQDPKGKLKKFWTFVAWDYERSDWFILEISQHTIINELAKMLPNLGAQDIKVIKGGVDESTRYMVFPCKPTMPSESVLSAQKSIVVNLEALYTGGDPLVDFKASTSRITPISASRGADYLNTIK